jgi:cyclopropane-fatty-acyl-phospholipid synthase
MNPRVLNLEDAKRAEPQTIRDSEPPAAHRSPPVPTKPPSLAQRLLTRLLDTFGQPRLDFVLPGGERIGTASAGASVGQIRFMDQRAVWRVISDPMFQFPEMYATGRMRIEGPLDQIMIELFQGMRRAGNRSTWLMRLFGNLHWPRGSSLSAARKNIHHHYDIGNEFYALWLDERMAYTCGYFPEPIASLEAAQAAKFDHVCRKVRLLSGMQVIEAGCGWGGLALHMARHYGVYVRAFNISHQQVVFARERARAEGLAERVEFIEDDWRAICGECDAFVSVGMLEHVGRRNYRHLGQVINRALRSAGRGLIHSIGQNFPAAASPWIERRIFPGGYPPSLGEMTAIFESNGLSVLDVENIRLHYALTLRHWLERFERHVARIQAMFDERFVRMWRFYLAGSLASFATGSYQLFQVVFNRATNNDVPLSRQFLYRESRPAESTVDANWAAIYPSLQ